MENNILNKTEEFVKKIYKKQLPNFFLYHNLSHTIEVFEISKTLADQLNVNSEDKEILLLAALLHDIGYANDYDNHEEKSAEQSEEYLSGENYSKEKIEIIKKLILSTKFGSKPETFLEEILHDADFAHVGQKTFFNKGELLRAEWENIKNKKFDNIEWEQIQLHFLMNTKFYTQPANEKFLIQQSENIQIQRKNLEKAFKNELRKKTGKDIGRSYV
jgi:putative nucleotidyltransferase with HDIG domain